MKRNKRLFFVTVLFLFSLFCLAAAPYANITYAEGSSFILIRDNEKTDWSVDDGSVFGMEVKPGDILQTAGKTFLEVYINPLSATVQIAENTSFRCDADSTGTQSSGALFYGRVRAKVAKLTGSSSYKITSPSLVAGVRGTEFGCDVIAVRPDSTAQSSDVGDPTAVSSVLNRVFCLEGSVMVTDASSQVVIINQDEMVEQLVDSVNDADSVDAGPLEKKSLDDEVRDFWENHPVLDDTAEDQDAKVEDVNLTKVIDRQWPEGQEIEGDKRNFRIPSAAVISLIGVGSAICIGTTIYAVQADTSFGEFIPSYATGFILIGTGSILGIISALF